MAAERRRIRTSNSEWSRTVLENTTTTDATPTTIYTSNVAIPEGRRIALRVWTIVSSSTTSAVSVLQSSAIVARATGANIRLVAPDFLNAQGEITQNNAKLSITVDTGTQRFSVVVTGKAATTYTWTSTIELLRNA